MHRGAALAAVLATVYYYFRELHVGTRGQVPLLSLGRAYGFQHDAVPDLRGKVYVVTGANSGLGRATAKRLALNGATVVMGCRSEGRGKAAAAEVTEEIRAGAREGRGIGTLRFLRLDLSSFASIRAFAAEFSRTFNGKLDGLINNAGVMSIPERRLSEDGIELHFAVNHVGHALLTELLLPSLRKAGRGARVVVVSSTSQHLSSTVPTTLHDINDAKTYSPYRAYSRSKLSNTLFAKELARRLEGEGIFVNCLDPGGVGSNILGNTFESWGLPKGFAEAFYTGLGATHLLVWNADTAALTPLYLATSPEIEAQGIHGQYFLPIAERWPTHHPGAEDKALGKRLWEFTVGLYGKQL
jgi:retinol dehydrogenase-14